VTLDGRFWQADDAVLLPVPKRRPRLMIGSNGPRMLGLTLPHVDTWNSWYDGFQNTPEGFAALDERISTAAREAGRSPADIERSACVLVRLESGSAERPESAEAPALTGPPARIAAALREFGEAGADELILVADPITERSVRTLAEALALL
jgi:alkanesulfonate monooxygenase SsuD/methylene tetrahydromethanopterin reductase-like flavin-dependent oxidoreductase (luciferase family)